MQAELNAVTTEWFRSVDVMTANNVWRLCSQQAIRQQQPAAIAADDTQQIQACRQTRAVAHPA
jgi:hypothetical protein